MSKPRALIVGCTGKLGSALLGTLRDSFELDVCWRLDGGKSSTQPSVVCGRTRDSFRLNDYPVIINCAWVAGVSSKSLRENIRISELLLGGARGGHFVYLSSIDVYGAHPISAYRCAPRSMFAFNKLDTELGIARCPSTRTKVVLRVGNFIPDEQLFADSASPVFVSQLDRSRPANLVGLGTLAAQIRSIASGPYEAGRVVVQNCVDEPNRTWGEVVDESLAAATPTGASASKVTVVGSKGMLPAVFKYLKQDGATAVGISLVRARVVIAQLLARFIEPPAPRGASPVGGVELHRVYQDYTLRG
jgi:nucleoside-diphosphate-sugar epimerase